MTNFHTQTAAALDVIKDVAGITVKYRRGSDWVSLKAVPGNTIHEVGDDFGGVLRYRSKDFIFEAAVLLLDGTRIDPEREDKIDIELNGSTETWEVMRESGEDAWSYSDAGQTRIRVHAKLISRVAI